jgi:hypothetical protein
MLVRNAINMPTPAINPSSDRPRYAVGRNDKKPRAGAPAGVQQRLAQAINLVPLGPVTHTVLEAEIDPEADKQYGEIDRDQIERADHHHAGRRGDRKPDNQAHEHCEDDAEPA